MLFGELRHRMKNLLAVAQSIARHTATAGRSAEEYRDDFLGRFDALVEAQDLAFADQDEPGLMALFERIFAPRSAEHTSELQSLMRISYAVFCLKQKHTTNPNIHTI